MWSLENSSEHLDQHPEIIAIGVAQVGTLSDIFAKKWLHTLLVCHPRKCFEMVLKQLWIKDVLLRQNLYCLRLLLDGELFLVLQDDCDEQFIFQELGPVFGKVQEVAVAVASQLIQLGHICISLTQVLQELHVNLVNTILVQYFEAGVYFVVRQFLKTPLIAVPGIEPDQISHERAQWSQVVNALDHLLLELVDVHFEQLGVHVQRIYFVSLVQFFQLIVQLCNQILLLLLALITVLLRVVLVRFHLERVQVGCGEH